MKSRFLLLSVLSIAALVTVDAQEANAQAKEGGARWKFAPNIYRVEQPRLPQGYGAPSVQQGAMPRSSSFLGLEPGMLNRPPAPAPVPQVAARPAMPQVTGRAFVPTTAFNPSFGQPVQPMSAGAPIQMAQLPPAVGPGTSTAPAVRQAAPAHRPVARSHNAHVSGKLLTPHKHVGQSASPAVASYSSGYMPGGSLPSHSSSGNSVSTNVNGRIIRH